jgi:BMFP domain-containing protein YqiC
MFDPSDIQKSIKKFVDCLPSELTSMRADFENQLQQFLQHSFEKMALTTKQEFEIQSKVLAKTRLKIEALEARLNKLETEIFKS